MCDTLRDGGVSYQNYVNELASLLFLKMCEKTGQEEELLEEGLRWKDLTDKVSQDKLQHYREMLVKLGKDKHASVRAIFQNVNTSITESKQLDELVSHMDKLKWDEDDEEFEEEASQKSTDGKKDSKEVRKLYARLSRDDFGDMYEGLLQKNANETKSGAGQYFTPRPLIKTMVRLMQPEPREIVQDPAAGTGGFLIEADRHIKNKTNDLEDLENIEDEEFQRTRAFIGLELVPGTRRLALMNCLLHDIDGEGEGAIKLGNTLGGEGKSLPRANVILTNPPFGSAAGTNITREFVHSTSNKQLCFMQHIYNNLEPGGRAAVVIPDNVLFEGGMGTAIRQDLMDKCNLHTILRLPTGIFYAAGVKTNVLFFQKGTKENPNQDKGCTKETWVFDLRTNMDTFGKRNPFTEKHLKAFEAVYGADKNGQSERKEGVWDVHGCTTKKLVEEKREEAKKNAQKAKAEPPKPEKEEQTLENARWRKFSREYIRDEKDDSLDISWLKDNSITDAASLGKPEVLAEKAMSEMVEALKEIHNLMKALGAKEQSQNLVNTLATEFELMPTEETESLEDQNQDVQEG